MSPRENAFTMIKFKKLFTTQQIVSIIKAVTLDQMENPYHIF